MWSPTAGAGARNARSRLGSEWEGCLPSSEQKSWVPDQTHAGLAGRLCRPSVVVHVPLPAVLLRHVLMGHVDVVHLRVVVLVGVGGEEVAPVLTSMEVVGDVEVLVTMLDGVV